LATDEGQSTGLGLEITDCDVEIPSVRRTLRLGDVCEKIGSGATPRGGADVYLNAGIALIRSQNVHNHKFSSEGLAYISDVHARELSNVEVKPRDVLLNITGDSVARCTQVPATVLPARVNQHVAIIRPDPNLLDAGFLRYFLTSPTMQSLMLALAGAGATRNALTKGMIENFKVPALGIVEQRRIAEILGALDDKIELNRRMTETLESIARAEFEEWFATLDCRIESADHLIGSGLLAIGDGYRAKNSELASTGLPFARAADVSGQVNVSTDTDHLSDDSVARAGEKISRVDDIVVTTKGTVGRLARVGASTPVFVYSPQLCYWRSLNSERLDPFLLYQWICGAEFREQLDRVSGQTDMAPYVSLKDQRQFRVPMFESENDIASRIRSIRRLIESSAAQSRTLGVLRDALLPYLLSGGLLNLSSIVFGDVVNS
jgi:Restriction endonuclease S subunits